jgi:hypothetical protein
VQDVRRKLAQKFAHRAGLTVFHCAILHVRTTGLA